MTNIMSSNARQDLILGRQVSRAAATVPTSAADQVLFNVVGGRVIVTALVGEVTTVIGGTTPSMKLIANPTATGASFDMVSAVAITADAVGNLYSLAATAGGALQVTESGTAVFGVGIAVKVGTIDCNISAADATGAIKWDLFYVPLDDNAMVTAGTIA